MLVHAVLVEVAGCFSLSLNRIQNSNKGLECATISGVCDSLLEGLNTLSTATFTRGRGDASGYRGEL